MGLNMPARTVLFTGCRKFDGREMRWITSGEYIQMSGRAGRRGLDDRGIVIMMVDEKMSSSVGKELLRGQPDCLNSAFHLTYNTVLNLLRVEEINPEYMLERSFFQFQNYSALPKVGLGRACVHAGVLCMCKLLHFLPYCVMHSWYTKPLHVYAWTFVWTCPQSSKYCFHQAYDHACVWSLRP